MNQQQLSDIESVRRLNRVYYHEGREAFLIEKNALIDDWGGDRYHEAQECYQIMLEEKCEAKAFKNAEN